MSDCLSLCVVDRAEYNQAGSWACVYQESGTQRVHRIYTKERIQVFAFALKNTSKFDTQHNSLNPIEGIVKSTNSIQLLLILKFIYTCYPLVSE